MAGEVGLIFMEKLRENGKEQKQSKKQSKPFIFICKKDESDANKQCINNIEKTMPEREKKISFKKEIRRRKSSECFSCKRPYINGGFINQYISDRIVNGYFTHLIDCLLNGGVTGKKQISHSGATLSFLHKDKEAYEKNSSKSNDDVGQQCVFPTGSVACIENNKKYEGKNDEFCADVGIKSKDKKRNSQIDMFFLFVQNIIYRRENKQRCGNHLISSPAHIYQPWINSCKDCSNNPCLFIKKTFRYEIHKKYD
ncbi:MAG: hypothetical protein UV63_C0001G0027 [Microgenomates group bacterium GW2011_GWC1_43_11]|uniref:Uncharacterized protein n=2 Tax=Candidatus Gottesmaniibacteriota TaxID=1752720 RepID=A0A0G1LNY0_9BACT|nr:MAG: hypothetical protein UV63_C0001G0027 [Microgenomates group bacterium GW2011_GWC1_43_11]KKT39116.1 MAG: hypothetical protein UW22_C0001G0027 [Candidatus Gottesmanbacteria bacterium GW2011_GWB1_44_11c]KKT61589.1 MAG: hypothetical protein UW52_C0001G0027 [Candidatus Gottesmanbacteria bacterium GW2011_GWA1_44_24b]